MLLYSVVQILFSAYTWWGMVWGMLLKCVSNCFGVTTFRFCAAHAQVPRIFKGSILLVLFIYILPRRRYKGDSYPIHKTTERSSNYY